LKFLNGKNIEDIKNGKIEFREEDVFDICEP